MCSKVKYMEAPQGTFNRSNLPSRISVGNFCPAQFCSSIYIHKYEIALYSNVNSCFKVFGQ